MKVGMAGSSGHIHYVLEALNELEDLSVVAVCPATRGENIAELISTLEKRGQWPQVFESAPEMVRDPDIEVVAVAGPFYCNTAIAMEAMRCDKAVFCEKPLALTLEDLDLLRRAHEETRAPLCAMMGLRNTPPLALAHRLMREDLIGEPVMVTAQKSLKLGKTPDFYRKRETYGGTIPWVAIHAIDWCLWLTGKRFTDVTARQEVIGNRGLGALESAAQMLFTMEGGPLAMVSADYLRPSGAYTPEDSRVRVVGTHGIIEVQAGHTYLTLERGFPRDMPFEPGPGFFAQFMRSLAGKGAPPITAEEGLYLTAAALLAREAADLGKTVRFAEYGW